jgi:hypothetical protein
MLSCSAAVGGTYTVTVTGTSAKLVHFVGVTVNVQDFSISANPGTINVAQGSNNSTTINVTSIGGFSGTVTLTATAPLGLTATPNPLTVTMSGSSILTVTANATILPGLYNVTVNGDSGILHHSTTVTINVSNVTITIAPPAFNQLLFKHLLSLSKTGNTQTWKIGVTNRDNVTTIFVRVQITGVDGSGIDGFTITTAVIQLAPLQAINNNILTQTFNTPGQTWTFTATIFWGTSATSLTNTSTNTVDFAPNSGSFVTRP